MAACPARASRNSSHSGSGSSSGAVADFQHALDLALGHQRHGPVGDEPLRPGQFGQRRRHAGRVGEVLGAAFEDGAAGRPRVESLRGAGRRRAAVALAGGVFQGHLVRPAQQHGGGVDLELAEDLVQDDPEGERQVEAAGDGPVDLAQGVDPLQAALQLRVQHEDLLLGPLPHR